MGRDDEGQRRGPRDLTIALSMAALCLVWGSTWLVIRAGLRDLPPFTSAGARFALASAVMLAIAPRLARREGGERPRRDLVLAMGVCNFALSYGIVYWTEVRLPSGLVSVLWSVFPLMTALVGHLFLPGERLAARQWGGFVAGFAGVALLFSTDLAQLGPEAVGRGAVLLASPAVSALGTAWVKRHGARTSSLLLNRDAMLLGALLLLATAALTEGDREVRWSAAAVASVTYLAIVGTVFTFGVYFWLMRYAPAYRLSLVAYVTPLLALGLGASLGDEPVGLHTLAGATLILSGVGLAARPRRAPTRAVREKEKNRPAGPMV